MEPIQILGIAPYPGMRELMLAVAEKREDIQLTAFTGNLDEGLRLATEAIKNGHYDIILSRGGTAELLSCSLDIPTLDVSISLGDILQVIKLAGNMRTSFAIVGFSSISDRVRLLREILKDDIDVYTIGEEGALPELLQNLREKGCQMIIGDVITTTRAQNMGFNSILITSNSETIDSAYNQAIKLCRSYSKLNNQFNFYRTVIDRSPAQIAVFDHERKCVLSTIAGNGVVDKETAFALAESTIPLPGMPRSSTFAKAVDDCFVSAQDEEFELLGSMYTAVYMQFRYLSPILQSGAVSVVNRQDAIFKHINHYYGTSGSSAMLRTQIDQLNSLKLPIVLAGERGTGKDSIAFYLYTEGCYCDHPMYVIDCALVKDKEFDDFLESPDSPLSEVHVTIYLKNMFSLSDIQLDRFFAYAVQSGLARRCRLIFSAEIHAGDAEDGAVINTVANRIDGTVLYLPPLRERISDIPDMAVLYIGQYNTELGKQIIGIDPDAMDALCAYEWPNNLDQLQQVLRTLVSASSALHISLDSVLTVLRAERALNAPSFVRDVDLHQPLDDILYDILRIVLKEEDGNQKRTAERLCISRSTLWRMLKAHELK